MSRFMSTNTISCNFLNNNEERRCNKITKHHNNNCIKYYKTIANVQ